jgi:DNA-binding response OmpR family regulator
MRILVIDDDERFAGFVSNVLTKNHYEVDIATDGNTGLELALSDSFVVCIINWNLPGRDGLSICRAIRNRHLPLAILLFGKPEIEHRILGLDNGADDYLVKPIHIEELLAHIRALSRRYLEPTLTSGDAMEIRWGDITLDMKAHSAHRSEKSLYLTHTEWQLLECLMRHPNQALSREQLFHQVWSYDSHAQLSNVDLYISYLRKKLGEPNLIETVRGIGYRLHSNLV